MIGMKVFIVSAKIRIFAETIGEVEVPLNADYDVRLISDSWMQRLWS